ncbi:hypothetical protein M3Y96_00387800 [Aphelenchoides besseyi]|nr:hypothetical protein M3Y96_00387800 [Aphelenchoides besseyi]
MAIVVVDRNGVNAPMDGSPIRSRLKRQTSVAVVSAASESSITTELPRTEAQTNDDKLMSKFLINGNTSTLVPEVKELLPAKRIRKQTVFHTPPSPKASKKSTSKTKKPKISKLPKETQTNSRSKKSSKAKQSTELSKSDTSHTIILRPRRSKDEVPNEHGKLIKNFARSLLGTNVKPKRSTKKSALKSTAAAKKSTSTDPAWIAITIVNNVTDEDVDITGSSAADLSIGTSPLKSTQPFVKSEPVLTEKAKKTNGRKRRLASFGVSKAIDAVVDCQPKDVVPLTNSASQTSTSNSLSSHDQSTLADAFEFPTAPATKRLKLECQPLTSKTNDQPTASFQPLQISSFKQTPMIPLVPSSAFNNYDPQLWERALHAQQQVYERCELENQARRLSIEKNLGSSTNRHKSQPPSDFTLEATETRLNAEERPKQALKNESKPQQREQTCTFKPEARREQAVVEKLLRKQSAASAAASIDFSSTHEDSLSPASRRLGRPLTVSIDSDPFAASFAAGRRDSRSVSSPAITGRRYAAYGTQQTESAAPVSSSTARQFYERMERRRLQNPLARGLVRSKRNEDDDYFYREVIVRNQTKANESTSENANEEEEIDVLGDDDFDKAPTIDKFVVAMKNEEADEILVKNPADECVADVRSVLPIDPPQISEEQSEEEQEAEEKSAVSPIDRIAVEVELLKSPLLKSHLRVLIPGIINQRATDLCTLGIVGGCSVFYSRTLANATRLRQRLILFSLDRLLAMEEAHAFLLYRLPDEFLASYFNLLRFLRISGSSLPTHLVNNTRRLSVRKANDFIRDFVNTKVVDPNLRFGRGISDIAALPNVSLVLVYPEISVRGRSVIKHSHKNMFTKLLPAAAAHVETVELRYESEVDTRTLVHMFLELVRSTVENLLIERPDDHVFLAGWGISTLINMHALQKVAGVAGVLNFAYPLRGPLGMRGTVDDATCITYCPSLFVVGDSASNVNLKDLQAMRKNMICDTGLVVVGGADDHLYVPPVFLSVERVSQHSVDRMILNHVVDFIKQVISEGGMSAREKRQYLVPIKLPNPFDVDLNTLKGRGSAMVQKIRHQLANTSSKPKQRKQQNG